MTPCSWFNMAFQLTFGAHNNLTQSHNWKIIKKNVEKC